MTGTFKVLKMANGGEDGNGLQYSELEKREETEEV